MFWNMHIIVRTDDNSNQHGISDSDGRLTAAEIRVREPSLEGVFLRLTGEELIL